MCHSLDRKQGRGAKKCPWRPAYSRLKYVLNDVFPLKKLNNETEKTSV
jgi:hypothetical protein